MTLHTLLTFLSFNFVVSKMGRKTISIDLVYNMKAVGQLPAPSFDHSADDGEDSYWTPGLRPAKDFSPATQRTPKEEQQLAACWRTNVCDYDLYLETADFDINHLGWCDDWKKSCIGRTWSCDQQMVSGRLKDVAIVALWVLLDQDWNRLLLQGSFYWIGQQSRRPGLKIHILMWLKNESVILWNVRSSFLKDMERYLMW